jgi:hypothetical protein
MPKDVGMAELKFAFLFHLPYWLLILIAVLAPFDQYQRDIFLGMSLQRILFVFLAALFFISLCYENRTIYFTPLIIPLFLYFVAQLIGAVQGEQSAAIKSIIRTSGYIALFLISANLPQSRKQILTVLLFFIFSLYCVEIFAVFKILTGKSLLGLNLIELKQQYLGDGKILRMFGTFENPHDFTIGVLT